MHFALIRDRNESNFGSRIYLFTVFWIFGFDKLRWELERKCIE